MTACRRDWPTLEVLARQHVNAVIALSSTVSAASIAPMLAQRCNAVLTLAQLWLHCDNVKTSLFQRVVFAGMTTDRLTERDSKSNSHIHRILS